MATQTQLRHRSGRLLYSLNTSILRVMPRTLNQLGEAGMSSFAVDRGLTPSRQQQLINHKSTSVQQNQAKWMLYQVVAKHRIYTKGLFHRPQDSTVQSWCVSLVVEHDFLYSILTREWHVSRHFSESKQMKRHD